MHVFDVKLTIMLDEKEINREKIQEMMVVDCPFFLKSVCGYIYIYKLNTANLLSISQTNL